MSSTIFSGYPNQLSKTATILTTYALTAALMVHGFKIMAFNDSDITTEKAVKVAKYILTTAACCVGAAIIGVRYGDEFTAGLLMVTVLACSNLFGFVIQYNQQVENEKRAVVPPDFLIDMAEKTPESASAITATEKYVKDLEAVLRTKGNSAIFLGPAGVGKTAVVEGIAHAIKNDQIDINSPLKKIRLYRLDHSRLMADTRWIGAIEERVNRLIAFTEKNRDVIVFIDEIHMVLGHGKGSRDKEHGFADYLKEPLQNGSLRIIGATTQNEYDKIVAGDAPFARRLNKIYISSPSTEDCVKILQRYCTSDSFKTTYPNVSFTDENLETIIAYTNWVSRDVGQPSKAKQLLVRIAGVASENEIITQDTIVKNFAKNNKIDASKLKKTIDLFESVKKTLGSMFPKYTLPQDVLDAIVILVNLTRNRLAKEIEVIDFIDQIIRKDKDKTVLTLNDVADYCAEIGKYKDSPDEVIAFLQKSPVL